MSVFFIFCLGNLIWKRSVNKAIVPDQCQLSVHERVEVKLKKLKPGEDWKKKPWCEDKVCSCACIHTCIIKYGSTY